MWLNLLRDRLKIRLRLAQLAGILALMALDASLARSDDRQTLEAKFVWPIGLRTLDLGPLSDGPLTITITDLGKPIRRQTFDASSPEAKSFWKWFEAHRTGWKDDWNSYAHDRRITGETFSFNFFLGGGVILNYEVPNSPKRGKQVSRILEAGDLPEVLKSNEKIPLVPPETTKPPVRSLLLNANRKREDSQLEISLEKINTGLLRRNPSHLPWRQSTGAIPLLEARLRSPILLPFAIGDLRSPILLPFAIGDPR